MEPQAVFGISVLLSLVVSGVIGARDIWPALRRRPRAEALRPLLLLHAFRFVGLAFLVPGVVSPDLPAGFAPRGLWGPGDVPSGTPRARRAGPSAGHPAGVGVHCGRLVDLLNAFYQGNRLGVGRTPGLQGAAYFIPTVLVPLLLVSHVLVFGILLKPEATVGSEGGHRAS